MEGKVINLILPIYFGSRKKYLMSLNWLQDVHYRARNKVKQDFHEQIGKILINDKISFKGSIRTHYKLYYKNKLCDAPNVVAVIDKFLLDALQEHNIIVQDNVQYYIASSWEVVEQDKTNPRIEVEIMEIECGKNR